MANSANGESGLVCSEALRDRIFEYLPPSARKLLNGIEVKLWPSGGDSDITLYFDPVDNILDIDVVEEFYDQKWGKLVGKLIKGCELDSVTGKVHAYCEYLKETDAGEDNNNAGPITQELVALERDVTTFTAVHEKFFLDMLDRL